MRPPAAIIAPAIDVARLTHDWEMLAGKEERTLDEFRLSKGKLLVEARKAFPLSGPKARGWGDLLRLWRVDDATALRYMERAGYRPARRDPPQSEENRPADKPAPVRVTRADAQAEAPDDDLPVVSDEARAAAKDRETRAGQSDPIDVRADKLRQLHEAVAHAHGDIVKVRQRGIHLTDCTTSPDEFHRMKNLMIDVVNEFLAELDAAGVLDEKDQQRRRQLTLLSGGKP